MIPLLLIHIMLQTNFVPSSNNIINGTYNSISSFSQLYQYTNAGTGGLEELFLMLLLYFIFTGAGIMAGRITPILSAFGAAVLMVPLSVLAQSVFLSSGGTIGATMPLIFVGISVLTGIMSLLSGFGSTYQ